MLGFRWTDRKRQESVATTPVLENALRGYSIEVLPRTAAKIDSFKPLLPPGTRVYIAHVEGTPIEDMASTARRLAEEGFPVMPHIPARMISGRPMLEDWLARYRGEAGVDQALLIGGGLARPAGDYHSSMQLMETGLFNGFTRLHVAGHPEGNLDIDADGGSRIADAALRWKQAFAARTHAEMAIVTQFTFEARPVLDWITRLRGLGIALPVHMGIAGPARLQTMLKFAITCGIGPSIKVLQRRAGDVSRLITPYEPTEVVGELAMASQPAVEQVHFFPLGGIANCIDWINRHGSGPVRPGP